jgi:hypothetical protein
VTVSPSADIALSGHFDEIVERRFVWPVTYKAADYIAFLNTRSTYRVLEAARRRELFHRIQRRIEARPSQVVTPEFVGVLTVARRLERD